MVSVNKKIEKKFFILNTGSQEKIQNIFSPVVRIFRFHRKDRVQFPTENYKNFNTSIPERSKGLDSSSSAMLRGFESRCWYNLS